MSNFSRAADFVRKVPALHRLLRPVVGALRTFRTEEKSSVSPPAASTMPHLVDAYYTPGLKGVGANPVGRNVVMLAASDLRIDPRIERSTRALTGAGYTVTIICPSPLVDEQPEIDWGDGVVFDWLPIEALSFLGRAPGFLAQQIYERAVAYAPFAFHAHDLWLAYAGLAASRATGAHFVVDFHEWTSENVYWDAEAQENRPFPLPEKLKLAALEAQCLAEASAVITVCDSIAEGLAEELGNGRMATVIRNVPPLALEPSKPYPPLKQQLGLAEDKLVLLWQGGTGPTRLIEPIIEALEHAPDWTFVIRGPSLELFGANYQSIAKKAGALDRLILLPPVPSRDVVAAGRGADAGIWTLPDLCRNFRLALPNKIFEYLAAGLPLLVAHWPEARKIAENHGAGLIFDPYDPMSIANGLNKMANEPEALAAMRKAVPEALLALDANDEWSRLATLYDGLSQPAE